MPACLLFVLGFTINDLIEPWNMHTHSQPCTAMCSRARPCSLMQSHALPITHQMLGAGWRHCSWGAGAAQPRGLDGAAKKHGRCWLPYRPLPGPVPVGGGPMRKFS